LTDVEESLHVHQKLVAQVRIVLLQPYPHGQDCYRVCPLCPCPAFSMPRLVSFVHNVGWRYAPPWKVTVWAGGSSQDMVMDRASGRSDPSLDGQDTDRDESEHQETHRRSRGPTFTDSMCLEWRHYKLREATPSSPSRFSVRHLRAWYMSRGRGTPAHLQPGSMASPRFLQLSLLPSHMAACHSCKEYMAMAWRWRFWCLFGLFACRDGEILAAG